MTSPLLTSYSTEKVWNLLLWNWEQDKDPTLTPPFNNLLVVLAREIRKEQETIGIQIKWQELKLSFADDVVCVKNPKDSPAKNI